MCETEFFASGGVPSSTSGIQDVPDEADRPIYQHEANRPVYPMSGTEVSGDLYRLALETSNKGSATILPAILYNLRVVDV